MSGFFDPLAKSSQPGVWRELKKESFASLLIDIHSRRSMDGTLGASYRKIAKDTGVIAFGNLSTYNSILGFKSMYVQFWKIFLDTHVTDNGNDNKIGLESGREPLAGFQALSMKGGSKQNN